MFFRPYLRLKRWWLGMVDSVEHDAILEQANRDGGLSYSYSFMVVIAAGIAMIGLLLNSPAVIIGAMLVSPLMGPIVLSGLSLTTLNPALGRRGFLALAAGAAIALLVSVLIVLASPISDVTPEILARTRPNLFDLVVAILSGAAGGYAMIRGRGGAIVGVAIATALMPPLAVVGYGIATLQLAIARGALLLFVTNMAAISLSVAFVASWYGFGRRGLRKDLAWQSGLALLVLVPLAAPLATSLRAIAEETYVNQTAKQVLQGLLEQPGQSRIVQTQVAFSPNGPVTVGAVLLTQKVRAGLTNTARTALERALHRQVKLELDQVLVSDVASAPVRASAVANPIQGTLPMATETGVPEAIRKAFPLPVRMMEADPASKTILILPKPGPGAGVSALHAMERELAARYPSWRISVIPPQQALPRLMFGKNASTLSATESDKLQDILWALRAWQVGKVRVIGFASTDGEGPRRLARARAARVAGVLEQGGVSAVTAAEYPALAQRQEERERGYEAFQAAEVRVPGSV